MNFYSKVEFRFFWLFLINNSSSESNFSFQKFYKVHCMTFKRADRPDPKRLAGLMLFYACHLQLK